jgi:hypothetical protein
VGTNSPVLDGNGEGTPLILAAPHATVFGFIIRNSGHDLTKVDSGVRINADDVTVKDCRVENDAYWNLFARRKSLHHRSEHNYRRPRDGTVRSRQWHSPLEIATKLHSQ